MPRLIGQAISNVFNDIIINDEILFSNFEIQENINGTVFDPTDNFLEISTNGTSLFTLQQNGDLELLGSSANLVVGGDLTINGDTTFLNTTNLEVEDPLTFIASANIADTLDTGYYAKYNDGSDRFTGIFRDASDGGYKFFDNLLTQPTTTVDTGAGSYNELFQITSAGTLVLAGGMGGDLDMNENNITAINNLDGGTAMELIATSGITNTTGVFIVSNAAQTGAILVTPTSNKVTITGSTGDDLTLGANNTSDILTITHSGGGGAITSIASGDFIVDTDTLFVDEGLDRVGINTATPSTALEVNGILTMGGDIAMGTNDITGATNITATNLTGTLQTAAQPNVTSLGTLTQLAITGDLTAGGSTLIVDTANNRIGINEVSPSFPLDVVGDINTTTDYNIGGTQVLSSSTLGSGVNNSSITSNTGNFSNAGRGTFTSNGNSTQQLLKLDNQTAGNIAQARFRIESDTAVGLIDVYSSTFSTTGTAIQNSVRFQASNGLSFDNRAGDMIFFTNSGTERMRLESGGFLGVNQTNPLAHLTISGDALDTNQPTGIRNTNVSDTHTGLFLSNVGNSILEKYGIQFGGFDGWAHSGIFGVMTMSAGNTRGDITFDSRVLSSDTLLTEHMRVKNTGEVVIGQTTALSRFSVNGATNSAHFLHGDANTTDTLIHIGGAIINQRKTAIITEPTGSFGRNKLHFALNGVGDLTDATKSDAIMTLLDTIQVGINTTDPKTVLHVHADDAGVSGLSGSTNRAMLIQGLNGNCRLYFEETNANTLQRMTMINHNQGRLTFNVMDDSGGFIHTDVLAIDPVDGNIGIGILTPSKKLQVIGDIRLGVDGDEDVNRVISSGGQLKIHANDSATNNNFTNLILASGNADANIGHIVFETDGLERVRFADDGNVGIGATVPSFKLDVQGTMRATGILTLGTGQINLIDADTRIKADGGNNLDLYANNTLIARFAPQSVQITAPQIHLTNTIGNDSNIRLEVADNGDFCRIQFQKPFGDWAIGTSGGGSQLSITDETNSRVIFTSTLGTSPKIGLLRTAVSTNYRVGIDGDVIITDGTAAESTASNQLEISSTTGALLVPRMTTTQRNNLTTANGQIIYNTTANAFQFRENGAWVTK